MAPPVDVIPLGGVGEFGMNMLLVTCGDTAIVVDAGVMFPEPELFGVDLVIPDLSPLDAWRGRIKALILTHGHEDHIGAVVHVIDRIDGPMLRAARSRLHCSRPSSRSTASIAGDRLRAVKPRDRVEVRPVRHRVPARHAQHSGLPGAGHSHARPASSSIPGDFKIDQTPLDGQHFDLHRFAELGAEGVLLLLSDSTNADRRGHTGSERDVVDGFEELFSSAKGKLLVTTFST